MMMMMLTSTPYIFYAIVVLFIALVLNTLLSTLSTDRVATFAYNNNATKIASELNFDFIVVGSGSSGSVLAHRLSTNSRERVLLLEAGGPDDAPEIKNPPSFMKVFGNEKYDWNLFTEPQPYMGGRRMFWPRGKTLGGSSSINAMIYQRGNAADYDEWEKKFNLTGWNYQHMLKFFKKATLQSDENLDHTYHGYDGRWRISNPIHPHELTLAMIESIRKAQGLPINHDANGRHQIGVGLNQVNVDRVGRRHSLSDAFLDNETLKRKNLFVRLRSQVTRVLIDEKTKTAIGVQYIDTVTKQTFVAYASKEVILASGAVHSPHILLHSGIGPEETLKKYNIPVVANLSGVGQNLLDHLQSGAMFRLKEEYRHLSLEEEQGPYQVFQWLLSGRGPLTSNGGELNGYFVTKYSEDPNLPDLQYLGIPGFYVDHARREARLKHPEGSFCLQAILLRPQSIGYLTINSSDPLDPPVIQPNYLKEEIDRLTLMEGFKHIRRAANTEPFAKYVEKELYPGSHVTSDEQISESLNQLAETLYHPVGTCKMGLETDPTAVVNERLQVIGIKNLRVVDASIMPTIVRGNTNAPVVAIAEKAYEDFIKRDHFLPY